MGGREGGDGSMVRPGADARLELCDTDSLIKESKDSTASWRSQDQCCILYSELTLRIS